MPLELQGAIVIRQNVSTCCLLESVKQRDVGRQDIDQRMHAPLDVRDERAFKVDPDRRSPIRRRRLNRVGKRFKRSQGSIDRSRYGRRKIAAHTFGREKSPDRSKTLGSCLHHVVTGSPMRVNVEKGRRECGLFFTTRRRLDGADETVFDSDNRMVDGSIWSDEASGGQYLRHHI